ncbi:MAG: D-Ala-D-Ala carboxypeptidase family metallohydrolase [Cyanobacteria bacterium J06638_20]
MIELVRVARYFDELPHQVNALEYLQDKVAPEVLKEFAERWRKQSDIGDLIDSARGQQEENDSPRTNRSGGIPIPGKGVIHLEDPIISGGSFTWGEALHGGERIPRSDQITQNIIALATEIEPYRQRLGKPLIVTSWYRPEPINSRVGGARRSQHLYGRAVDLRSPGMTGADLAFGVFSDPNWDGGLGLYRNLKRIVHLDIGPRRRWGV